MAMSAKFCTLDVSSPHNVVMVAFVKKKIVKKNTTVCLQAIHFPSDLSNTLSNTLSFNDWKTSVCVCVSIKSSKKCLSCLHSVLSFTVPF